MSISFVVSKSEALLEQYYALREECFRKELGVADFDGGEDEDDRRGTVLLAVENGNRVIAGARIVGSYADNPTRLPMENDDFRIRDSFPALGLAGLSYCYWGRLAIRPQYRSNKLSKLFLREILELSAELGFYYAFIVTDASRSRFYRLMHTALGYEYRILDEVTPAEQKFSGLEHLIAYSVLRPADRRHQRPIHTVEPTQSQRLAADRPGNDPANQTAINDQATFGHIDNGQHELPKLNAIRKKLI